MATTGTTPTRSDAEIFVDARRALDRRPSIPATVRVHIEHGIATLTGTVRLPAERAEAEAAVRDVAGIRRIVNEIAVSVPARPEGYEPPDDR